MAGFVALRGRYNILTRLITTALTESGDEIAAAEVQRWQLPASEAERKAMIVFLSAKSKAHDVSPLHLRTASAGFKG